MTDQNQQSSPGDDQADERKSFSQQQNEHYRTSIQPYINQHWSGGWDQGLTASALHYSQQKLLKEFQKNPDFFDQVKELLQKVREVHTLLVQRSNEKTRLHLDQLGEKPLPEFPSNTQQMSEGPDIASSSENK